MIEALQFEFMRNALLAGLLASIACGIIGTLLVDRIRKKSADRSPAAA